MGAKTVPAGTLINQASRLYFFRAKERQSFNSATLDVYLRGSHVHLKFYHDASAFKQRFYLLSRCRPGGLSTQWLIQGPCRPYPMPPVPL
jgi:hypothetical protein